MRAPLKRLAIADPPTTENLLMSMKMVVDSFLSMLAEVRVRDISSNLHRRDGLFDIRHGHLRAPAMAATSLLMVLLVRAFSVGNTRAAETPAKVDAARMKNADRDAGNWLSYGRTYSEQRFSPLTRITSDNARQLGLAWFADLDTNRGQQATPLVI
ncbi:MAG TPA: hypothetical protein VK821_12945, partial [Dehalococcoidia bacterium]|nr:hypothetical protein [Dehalococcoidia bacterium]